MWIGISGAIASGKTTLARALARELDVPVASFGDYLRAVAAARHLPGDRGSLQELGQHLIDEHGWQGFASGVLAAAGVGRGSPAVVIDGVRHVEIAGALRDLAAPETFVLVYLDVPSAARLERAGTVRDEDDSVLAKHPVEADTFGRLREEADVVVPAGDVESTLGHVLAAVRKWRPPKG
jgi:adenylate kinase family enzyme